MQPSGLKIGDRVISATKLCNVYYDQGCVEHECIADVGDVGEVVALNPDGTVSEVSFADGVWYDDGFGLCSGMYCADKDNT